MKKWICTLKIEAGNRPGTISRIAHVFSDRGISMIDLLAATWHGPPVILVTFEAADRLGEHLRRRLGRINEVTGVDIQVADERAIWRFLDPPPSSADDAAAP